MTFYNIDAYFPFAGTDRSSSEPVEDTETTSFVAEIVRNYFFILSSSKKFV